MKKRNVRGALPPPGAYSKQEAVIKKLLLDPSISKACLCAGFSGMGIKAQSKNPSESLQKYGMLTQVGISRTDDGSESEKEYHYSLIDDIEVFFEQA